MRVHASAGSSFSAKYDDVTVDSRAASFLQKDLSHWASAADASFARSTRAPIVSMSFLETPGVIDVARSFLENGDVESRIRAGGSVALEALAGSSSLDSGAQSAAREAAARELVDGLAHRCAARPRAYHQSAQHPTSWIRTVT